MRQLKTTNSITEPDCQGLDVYFKDISKISLISREEEAMLVQKIKNGEEAALWRLVCANLRFVVFVAKQYRYMGLSLIELIAEGNDGLEVAAKNFDVTLGNKFISYAVWWIRRAIITAISQQTRVVRLPLSQVYMINKINKASIAFENEFEHKPALRELSMLLQIPIEKISDSIDYSSKEILLDDFISSKTGITSRETFLDTLDNEDAPPDQSLINESLRKAIFTSVSKLPKNEQEIIVHCFGLDTGVQLTTKEVAEKFNLTSDRVRQIKERALKRMKKGTTATRLKEYL
jgi:RNA polymerase primary sigma factor